MALTDATRMDDDALGRHAGDALGTPSNEPVERRRGGRRFGWLVYASIAFLVLLLALALFPSFFAPKDPAEQTLSARLQGPSSEFLLGADDFGRDQLSRLIYGTRTSLFAAALSTIVALAVGAPAGLVAGYVGGRVDGVLRAISDGIMSVPGLLITIAVVSITGPSLTTAMSAYGVVLAPRFFRIQRGTTVEARSETYVEACQALGCSQWRIMWRHIVPNTISPTLVQISLILGVSVILEASISFIGLGVQPPTPSWGGMLTNVAVYMERAPHLVFPAGIAIVLTVMAFSYVGDALRDVVSGRQRAH